MPHHHPENQELETFKYDEDDRAAACIEKRNDGLHPKAQFLMEHQQLIFYNHSESPFRPVTEIQASIMLIESGDMFSWKPTHSSTNISTVGREEVYIDGMTDTQRNEAFLESRVHILVQPHPYGVVSDKDGFATPLLPVGKWSCSIKHRDLWRPNTILDRTGKAIPQLKRTNVILDISEVNNEFTFVWDQRDRK